MEGKAAVMDARARVLRKMKGGRRQQGEKGGAKRNKKRTGSERSEESQLQ